VDRSLNVQYQFVFFDRTGKQLDGQRMEVHHAGVARRATDWKARRWTPTRWTGDLTVRSAK